MTQQHFGRGLPLEASLPEIQWNGGDDLCDCTFQRAGWWTDPYTARTLEIRLCCMWERLNDLFPGLMRLIPGWTDYNNGNRFVSEPMMWNGESDMGRAQWYRQIQTLTGKSLPKIREEFAGQEPPRGIIRPKQPEPVRRSEPVKVLRGEPVTSQSNVYELLGRATEENRNLRLGIARAGELFRLLKDGKISLDRIEVLDGEVRVLPDLKEASDAQIR